MMTPITIRATTSLLADFVAPTGGGWKLGVELYGVVDGDGRKVLSVLGPVDVGAFEKVEPLGKFRVTVVSASLFSSELEPPVVPCGPPGAVRVVVGEVSLGSEEAGGFSSGGVAVVSAGRLEDE